MKRIWWTLRLIKQVLLLIAFILILYLFAAAVGSLIPVNQGQPVPETGIEIFISTNGVHTSFILPSATETLNWEEFVDPAHTLSGGKNSRFISFGWGDLAFYRNTPEWSDLTFTTAFRAAFLRSPSAINVEFLEKSPEGPSSFPMTIKEEQYQRLARFIKESFELDRNGKTKPVPGLHYNERDVFYHSKRSLNLFYTCNTWTNQGLKESGLKACLWTPIDRGILYHYR